MLTRLSLPDETCMSIIFYIYGLYASVHFISNLKFGMVLDGCLLPFLVNKDYRYPDGPDTTGGTTHDTKKHDTNTGTTRWT
jgi:hypothetical protein